MDIGDADNVDTPISARQVGCSVCFRPFAVTAAGMIRIHGPVRARCPGSRRPPVSGGVGNEEAGDPPRAPTSDIVLTSSTTAAAGLPPRSTEKILKRIPKASRLQAGRKMATILEDIVWRNDHAAWDRLARFPSRCLRAPKRGGRRCSLASKVNRQLDLEAHSAEFTVSSGPKHSGCRFFPKDSLAARVSAKLEEGDFRGAVRLASSDATLAPMDNSTFAALQEKHPPSHPDSIFPPLQEDFLSNSISASDEDIIKAIRSFPNGSAGGPDGLRPQHLKDMIDSSADGGCQVLLPALTSFVELVLAGRTPSSITPYFLELT